ncbi:MAG: PAS domain S-box-containing protein, partial [Planctomycetota bacterium]
MNHPMSTTYDADVLLGLQQAVLEKLVRRVDRKIILDNLCKVVEGAIPDTLCSIMELTGSGNLRVLAAPCVPKDLVSELNGLIPSALAASCGTAVFTSQTVIVEDTLTDPRWESMRKQAIQYGIKSCWSIPIFAGDGEVMGSFAISHLVHRTPDEIHLRLLEMGGCLVGLTLERDRDEAELRQKKTLLDNIIQSTEDPIFAKDLEGRYLIANEATALTAGTGPQEMVGRKDEEIFDPEIAAGFKATDKIVYDTGEAHHYEDVFHQPGAGDRRFLVCKTPLRSSTGAFSGIVGVARDVTELRRAEEAMLQTQKLESLGVLTGGIAHDFNNLLTGILGHAELARARSRGGPAESNLREIERAATQAADLVTQMLAYAGRAEAKKTKVDLASLVREVSSLIDSSVSKKTDLSFRFSDDLPAINADASQIRQVVMNLIINASEALNGATGRVDVDIQKYNKHLLLTVTDSGHGMDDETRGRIFDPFFSTKFTGRGLGLAAVQGIIRGHEGRI